jgi:hypothetical protein
VSEIYPLANAIMNALTALAVAYSTKTLRDLRRSLSDERELTQERDDRHSL